MYLSFESCAIRTRLIFLPTYIKSNSEFRKDNVHIVIQLILLRIYDICIHEIIIIHSNLAMKVPIL